MIVQQSSKINRKNSRFRALGSVFSHAQTRVSAILLLLLLVEPFCQRSSAQEPQKSTESRKKLKESRKRYLALGSFDDKRITESSGVALAGPNSDGEASNAIWTFNDSGGAAMLFRVGFKGKTEATLAFREVANRDWESMCQYSIEDRSFLAVGDVGDNLRRNKSCQIHIIAEPTIDPKFNSKGKLKVQDLESKVQTFDFTYEDGPHNCEAMAYDTQLRQFWFVEKVYVDDRRKVAPGIYVLGDPMARSPHSIDEVPKYVAKRVADFPVRNVTGMAFSPDNNRLVIRDYFGVWLYEKSDGKTWLETIKATKPTTLALPLQSQGEAVCFTSDSQSLLVTSEFAKSILWQVQLGEIADKEKK